VQSFYQMESITNSVIFLGSDLCPGVTFDFPRDNQVIDYVRYRSYFPALNEGTICFWVNTNDYNVTATGLFSYAVSGSHNELLLEFRGPGETINFLVNNGLRLTSHLTDFQLSGVQQV